MTGQLIKYISVFLLSMFKFIGGPALGAAYGLTFFEKFIFTVLGMMTTVLIISYFGMKLRRYLQRRFPSRNRRFTRRNRRMVYLWRHYGEFGVSFFTPILFSPVVGTLIVTALGGKRKKVIGYMLVSAVFWALAISTLSELILKLFTTI